MATTKRIIGTPTLNQQGQVTGGSSAPGGYLRKLPNELPGGDGPNPKRVIQTPQTDANGNITGGGGKKIAMNSPEEPEVWTYKGNNGVVQTIDKRVQQGGQPATTYGSKTDRSATLLNTGKNGATNGLPQATPAGLPGVTKYAGIDKGYGNNQAGIDLVNKQGSTEMLTAGESAQRTAGQYEKMPLPGQKIANVIKYQDNSDGTTTQYLDDGTSEIVRLVRNVDGTYSTQDVGQPAPTVATTQNPVIKKTLDKPQEQTVTPAVLQGADMNTLNNTLDELNYKVNVEGKTLTKDEYLTYASAKRQLQDMMKPQALTGGLDGLIANKEQDIKQATDESKINNEQELADFTKSQEVYKQAELDNIQKSFEREQETMRLILAGQGAGQGTFAVDKLNELSQNNQQKISILNEAVQAKIDLYGSQLRKDSQATIEAMKTRLDNFYLKAADLDVKNIEMMNAYNKEQGADKIKQLDGLMALAQSQALSSKELTPEEQKQVDTFANNLYDENGNFKEDVFKMLKEINPNLANLAVYNGGAIQKQRIADKLAMQGLDADIKKAQLNKLLNPDVDWKDSGEVDANGNPILYDPKNPTNTTVIPVGSTDVGGLSGADLAKTLASGKIDGKKFFGVYATGDPDGTQFASIYNKVAEQGLDAYMKSRQDRGSKITADMVNQAAIATGVDPITIAAKMAQDSGMGTQGKGARNNNPGNVGQFDSLDAKGITVKGYPTLEDGVLAVADNFKKRQDALLSIAGRSTKNTELTNSDIAKFNDNTFNPDKLKSSVDKEKYKKYLDQKSNVMGNKDSSIQDIIAYSAGGKELDATAIQRLDKYSTVLGQLDGIQKQISTMDTGPILGKLRDINPYDTNAQVLKAQLQALIPNLARGVYGEVGVLTDADIKNYAQTIPNLTQTKDVQNAILALTLDTLAGGYKNQLQTLAASKRDVSGFAGLYESIKGQADAIRSSIGGKTPSQNTTGGGRRQG